MMQKMTLVLDSDKYILAESYFITVNGVVYMKGSNDPLKSYNSDKGKVVKLKVCKYNMTDGIVYYDEDIIEKEYKISRLVATTYIPRNGSDKFFERNQVYIKDRDYSNFRPENLMWANSDETNALLTFRNAKQNALEKYIRYCIKHYISNAQIIYLLKESGYIKEINKRFFKERYIMKIVNKLRAEAWEEKNNVDMY